MKRILMSLVTIAIVGALITGGTMAYFSDVETVGVGDIQAGTLDLTVNDENPCTQHITIPNIAPGWSRGGKGYDMDPQLTWALKNTGSLPGKVTVEFSAITNDDNFCNEPEEAAEITEYGVASPGDADGKGEGELGSYLKVKAYNGNKNKPYTAWDFFGFTTLNGVGGNTYDLKALEGWDGVLHENDYVTISLYLILPEDVGNIIQSDSVEFDIIFHLDQVAP